jgi:Flp pilus assembly protein TadD
MQRGELENAEAEFRKAVEGSAASGPAWANLGILNELYFGMPEVALECYTRYLATRPADESVVTGWIQELREGTS